MGAMLGVVLSDNLILLFVFWELTGFTSYLLIGFDHDRREARARGAAGAAGDRPGRPRAARGGHPVVGQRRRDQLLRAGSPRHPPDQSPARTSGSSGLVLLAAFTKSAQFPFHFWLPNAMQAPTPVSAYLHSATMVKAGVYLVARMTPLLGGTHALVHGADRPPGAVDDDRRVVQALLETDLKRVLAYSTIGALGVLMLLLGIGTTGGGHRRAWSTCWRTPATRARCSWSPARSTTRPARATCTALGGLRRSHAPDRARRGLAAASMAGLPLFARLRRQGAVLRGRRRGRTAGVLGRRALVAAVAASALLGARRAWSPASRRSAGSAGSAPRDAHEAPFCAVARSAAAGGGRARRSGSLPSIVEMPVSVSRPPAATGEPVQLHLAVWHGVHHRP